MVSSHFSNAAVDCMCLIVYYSTLLYAFFYVLLYVIVFYYYILMYYNVFVLFLGMGREIGAY